MELFCWLEYYTEALIALTIAIHTDILMPQKGLRLIVPRGALAHPDFPDRMPPNLPDGFDQLDNPEMNGRSVLDIDHELVVLLGFGDQQLEGRLLLLGAGLDCACYSGGRGVQG